MFVAGQPSRQRIREEVVQALRNRLLREQNSSQERQRLKDVDQKH